MSTEQKPGDPADRAVDAKADGAFGGAVSHRAGYGGIEFEGRTYTKLQWVERTARTGGTLAAGEGRMLLAEIDRLRGDLQKQADWADWAKGEIDRQRVRCRQIDDEAYDYAEQIEQLKAAAKDSARAERILAALREPSEDVSNAVWSTWGLWDAQNHFAATLHALVRAAVAAAEQEVGP